MTRHEGFTPDWWEFDPSEQPIPLAGESAETGSQAAFEIADEAESIVRTARDDLAREDTDPTGWATDWRRTRRPARSGATAARSLAMSTALVLSGCITTFSLGWVHGAQGREPGQSVQQIAPEGEGEM